MAVRWKRRRKWQRPMGTRRQRKATLAYFQAQVSGNVYDALALLKWMSKTARQLPRFYQGGEVVIEREG